MNEVNYNIFLKILGILEAKMKIYIKDCVVIEYYYGQSQSFSNSFNEQLNIPKNQTVHFESNT